MDVGVDVYADGDMAVYVNADVDVDIYVCVSVYVDVDEWFVGGDVDVDEVVR